MIHPADYSRVRPAVDRAFELFPAHAAGRRVLIKPNVLRSSREDEGIVTHPAVLRAVVDRVEELGPASIVVGDNPGLFNYGDNEACFRESGLMEAAKGYYANIGTDAVRFDFNPGFMRAAREFGLGELDLSSIELEGELQELPGFSLPPLGGEALLENTDIQGMISGKTSLIPRADPELCTGCETCVEQCPVSALSMEGGLPVVDGEACITCFCCQEICPEKAVTLR